MTNNLKNRSAIGQFKEILNLNDIVGKRFNNLSVLSYAYAKKYTYRNKERRSIYYNCECSCGNNLIVLRNTILSKQANSCKKCTYNKMKESIITVSGTLTHNSWRSMRQRCNNSNRPEWKHYGGRGIKYCDRWNNYANFLEDMGHRPKDMTLDRIDSNGNYYKDNCRWASNYQQKRNTRKNKMMEHAGRILAVSEWAELTGIRYGTLIEFFKRNSSRTVGDALKYFRMNDEDKKDFNAVERHGGYEYNGKIRSNPWIAKRLGVTPGALLKRIKKTSAIDSIKYFRHRTGRSNYIL